MLYLDTCRRAGNLLPPPTKKQTKHTPVLYLPCVKVDLTTEDVNLVLLLPSVKLGHAQRQQRDKPTNIKVVILTLCETGPNQRDKTTNTKVLILHCVKLGQTTETRQWTIATIAFY